MLFYISGKTSPTKYGSLCVINTGKDLRKSLITVFFYATSGVCFIGIIATLSILTCYVHNEEKKLVEIRSSQRPTRTNEENNNDDSDSEIEQDVYNHDSTQGERSGNSKDSSIAMSSLKQSSLYVFTFLFTYLPMLAQLFTNGNKESDDKIWAFWLISFTWPLGGFLNILIYTRPKVMKLKECHPEMSWFARFGKVVLSGGEIPVEAISTRRHNRRPKSKHNHEDNGERVQNEVEQRDEDEGGNQNKNGNNPKGYPLDICMDVHQRSSSSGVRSSELCYNLGSHEEFSEDNILYNRESNWSYVEGGSELEIFGAIEEEDEMSEEASA